MSFCMNYPRMETARENQYACDVCNSNSNLLYRVKIPGHEIRYVLCQAHFISRSRVTKLQVEAVIQVKSSGISYEREHALERPCGKTCKPNALEMSECVGCPWNMSDIERAAKIKDYRGY